MPLTVARAVSLAGGSEEDGSFFPRERKKFCHLPLQNTTQQTRKPSGHLVLGGEGRVRPRGALLGPLTCSRLSAVHRASPAPWLRMALSGSPLTRPLGWDAGRPRRPAERGPLVARAQRAPRAQSAGLRADDARGPPPPPLMLLPPRAGCGRERRRGPAARRPSHAAILTRAASPRAPAADFRNQKAISSSPGKGTMRRRGREPRGANA